MERLLSIQERLNTLLAQPIHNARADLPRMLREDDVYDRYDLESGSLVIVNIW